MDYNKKKFGFTIWFHDRNKNLTINWYDFPEFACADTAGEAMANLVDILDGSIPLWQLPDKGSKAELTRIELHGDGKRLFRLNGLKEVKNQAQPWLKTIVTVQWKYTVFDDVNRELLDALVQTFPEQQRIFKGKFLEDALGL